VSVCLSVTFVHSIQTAEDIDLDMDIHGSLECVASVKWLEVTLKELND